MRAPAPRGQGWFVLSMAGPQVPRQEIGMWRHSIPICSNWEALPYEWIQCAVVFQSKPIHRPVCPHSAARVHKPPCQVLWGAGREEACPLSTLLLLFLEVKLTNLRSHKSTIIPPGFHILILTCLLLTPTPRSGCSSRSRRSPRSWFPRDHLSTSFSLRLSISESDVNQERTVCFTPRGSGKTPAFSYQIRGVGKERDAWI